MNHQLRHRIAALSLGAVMLISAVGCDMGTPTPTPPAPNPTNTPPQATATPESGGGATAEPTDTASVVEGTRTPSAGMTPQAGVTPVARYTVQFADYKLQPSSVNPKVEPYKVAPGLANVDNASAFELSDSMKSLLEKNAFGAQFPAGDIQYRQFYHLYEDGRYQEQPMFVTTDSVLHVYHLMFDKILRSTETNYLIGDAQKLTASLLKATQAQYDTLKGTPGENAAKRNLAYFAVASRLLDPNAPIPAPVQNEVNQELKL
ncbi:MAG TPA: DUF3160 domain-containing protein, partial [Chloroflexia bacterium]|nr:DUF3160 domain-containing protein [Chloroflexia bacterium]